MADSLPSGLQSKQRLEALSDGIFAIALTLLVFNLKIPEASSPAQLHQALARNWELYAAYALTFFVLAGFWVGHHAIFFFIRGIARPLLWLNILFLFFVSGFPFAGALVAKYPGDPWIVFLYGAYLVLTGLVEFAIWEYAIRSRHGVVASLDPQAVRVGRILTLGGSAIYTVGTAFAWLKPAVSLVIFLLVPLGYVIPAILWPVATGRFAPGGRK